MTNIKIQARCVLLDIEGTISDIRFVYDVMFPYAKKNLEQFLAKNWESPPVLNAIRTVAKDATLDSIESWLGPTWQSGGKDAVKTLSEHCLELMATDSKATGLKLLQGMVWQFGFESGALRAELFADVLPALEDWKASGMDLRIYSSGSVLAQKMVFKFTVLGDLTDLFSAHYDTTIGTKKDVASYERIAAESQFDPTEIVFVTDVYSELIAASQAGMQVVASLRPNNLPLPAEFTGLTITSFSQLKLSSPIRLSDT
jgi:enolase-phosphatase E1